MQVALKRQHHPLTFFRLFMLIIVLLWPFGNSTPSWWCDHFMVIFNYRFMTFHPMKEKAETARNRATTHHETLQRPAFDRMNAILVLMTW